jgi:hypothetical protein
MNNHLVSKRSLRRLWHAHFNGPLYVPEEGQHVLMYLDSGGPIPFIEQLERLSVNAEVIVTHLLS